MRSDSASLLNNAAATALWLGAPGWIAIAVLLASAQISWAWALTAAALIYGTSYVLAWRGLVELERVRRRVLEPSPAQAPAAWPDLRWEPARKLAAAASEAMGAAAGEQGRLRRQSAASSSLLQALPEAVLLI